MGPVAGRDRHGRRARWRVIALRPRIGLLVLWLCILRLRILLLRILHGLVAAWWLRRGLWLLFLLLLGGISPVAQEKPDDQAGHDAYDGDATDYATDNGTDGSGAGIAGR